jgi:ATP-dependent protease Clp ATPase subunit
VEQLSKKSLEGVKFCLSSISTVQYLSKNDTYVIGKKTKKKLLEVNSPWHYPILNSKGKFMCYRDGYNIINNFKINSFIQK